MTHQTLSNLLVLFMLFIGNARFLIARHTKKDSLSILPFAGLFVAVINVLVFALTIENCVILILAFFSSVWNVRAVLRMLSEVIIDQYEIKLKLICSINAILSAVCIAGVIYFRPMDFSRTKSPVSQETLLYSGTLQTGFSRISRPFVLTDVKVLHFEPQENTSHATVLFVPPSTATAELYTGFFQKLARSGFSVYAADFYTDSAGLGKRWTDSRIFKTCIAVKRKLSGTETDVQQEKLTLETEFWSLLSICISSKKDAVFLVTDDDPHNAMESVMRKSMGTVSGCFDLSYINDYPTKGFGPVENSYPLLGAVLGVQPDRSGYMSSHLGTGTASFINSQLAGSR